MMETVFALAVLATAFVLGPSVVPVRAGLRSLGATPVRSYQVGATVGLFVGMTGAVLTAPIVGANPAMLAALCLLALLAACDLAWRWVPPIWSVLLGSLALVPLDCFALLIPKAIDAAAIGVFLIVLRQVFLILRKVEALGLGDVWLASAVALHLGLLSAFQVLGVAALLGLATELLLSVVQKSRKRRLGVAYGTHICVISALFFAHSAKIQTISYTCPQ